MPEYGGVVSGEDGRAFSWKDEVGTLSFYLVLSFPFLFSFFWGGGSCQVLEWIAGTGGGFPRL